MLVQFICQTTAYISLSLPCLCYNSYVFNAISSIYASAELEAPQSRIFRCFGTINTACSLESKVANRFFIFAVRQ